MCLILFSFETHPRYRLVLAANRDEYYDRPTEPLGFWKGRPDILAGRDLRGSGVWLGVTRSGRIAAITNYRQPALQVYNAPSRGLLVSDFLAGEKSPEAYLGLLETSGHLYNGFNLLVGDASGLFYFSNRGSGIRKLEPGLYGLSNHLLNTPWPKVEKGKAALGEIVANKQELDVEEIFGILYDKRCPPDEMLPDTGVELSWERTLSPLFITSPFYGTRSSSVVLLQKSGEATFAERTFESRPGAPERATTRKFTIMLPA